MPSLVTALAKTSLNCFWQASPTRAGVGVPHGPPSLNAPGVNSASSSLAGCKSKTSSDRAHRGLCGGDGKGGGCEARPLAAVYPPNALRPPRRRAEVLGLTAAPWEYETHCLRVCGAMAVQRGQKCGVTAASCACLAHRHATQCVWPSSSAKTVLQAMQASGTSAHSITAAWSNQAGALKSSRRLHPHHRRPQPRRAGRPV